MILKGTDVIGHKIIALNTGEEIDSVKDLVYDPGQNKIVALVADKKGLFSDSKVIALENIKSIGEDAVIIENKDLIQKASDIKGKISDIAKGNDYLTKSKIVTEDGKDLGNISDIIFDSNTGNVENFEITGGTIENMKSGKKYIKAQDIVTIGEDATIVSSYATEMFNQQGQNQGAQGMAKDMKEKASNMTDQIMQKASELGDKAKPKIDAFSQKAKEKVQDVKENVQDPNNQQMAKEKANNTVDTAKEKMMKAKDKIQRKVDEGQTQVKQNRIKDALGKYLKINILSKEDKIIAKQGDMVTHEIVDKAERNGMLDQLLNNVTADRLRVI